MPSTICLKHMSAERASKLNEDPTESKKNEEATDREHCWIVPVASNIAYNLQPTHALLLSCYIFITTREIPSETFAPTLATEFCHLGARFTKKASPSTTWD